MDSDHLFVITGGPGSGKSTLLEALAGHGICSMPEAGRAIIQDQLSIGGQALPWHHPGAFAELMLSWEIRYVLGCLRFSGLPILAHIDRAARIFRYHQRVFVALHWPEIFRAGPGDLIALPQDSVQQRVRFVLSAFGESMPCRRSQAVWQPPA